MSFTDLPLDLKAIEAARVRISGQVLNTPFLPAKQISDHYGIDLWVKYENMQVTHSFKERGALNRLLQLSDDEKKRGVIAMSAGNHAQAVAYHAARLNIPATIVMPETTPFVKVEGTRGFGAEVVLAGETVSDSESKTFELQRAHNFTLIHPYDDVVVIAGQGTLGLEMLEVVPELDAFIIPVGGGGLSAGIALAAKSLKPAIKIYGVQSEHFPSMQCALNNLPPVAPKPTLAEGIGVKNAGKLTRVILAKLMDRLVLVSETELESAISACLNSLKTLAEGAGAAGLAALPQLAKELQGQKVGVVLCGGNIDPRMAATVMVRALEREEKIVAFRISINDRPGVLGLITTLFGQMGANILEVEHRRLFLNMSAKGASIDITVETRDAAHAHAIEERLHAEGLPAQRIDAGEAGF